ncbi:MAG: DUF1080 domain-containing protein [Planctomycetia bacterium]|nr:DUF1080 domain-containing protein [Planctomycetia bacterium]
MSATLRCFSFAHWFGIASLAATLLGCNPPTAPKTSGSATSAATGSSSVVVATPTATTPIAAAPTASAPTLSASSTSTPSAASTATPSTPWTGSKLTSAEIDAGWLSLFDGNTLYGWEPASEADWKVVDGTITVATGKPGLLCTTSDFGDYEFKCDFKAPEKTNSGIFLRTPLKPTDAKTDCYELNIAAPEVSPFSNGGFVGRVKATKYIAATEWRTYDVSAVGGHFVIKIDGETVLDYTDPTPVGRGRIGLQLNSGEVAFRNIKLKPLGLKSLFNGKDLAGWKVKEGPELKSVYSVTPEGAINVKNGRGQLESDAQFADFTLQFEVFSNGKHLNSGVFFRSIPGETMNGYEFQVQNGYKDGDRTKPLDCGTGGIFRRQDARMVVSDDFAWTHMTLIASGPHMAGWVNGVQVSDWTDARPADANPRKGLRIEPGTFIIQGHDPTTDLSFRDISAAELPKR